MLRSLRVSFLGVTAARSHITKNVFNSKRWGGSFTLPKPFSTTPETFSSKPKQDFDEAEIVEETTKTSVDKAEAKKSEGDASDSDLDVVADLQADKPVPPSNETAKGAKEKKVFQTETKKILDIVANSLYTDKEVFLRELISNASDALEKARYHRQSSSLKVEPDLEFKIKITVDEASNTLIIQDTGVGMTKSELVDNLGTIARSGSKAFQEALAAGNDLGIIGQFGVGFYSSFMVADKVDVFSKSGTSPDEPAHYWTSDGSGEYEISEADNVTRGTKIVLYLKQSCKDFAIKHMVEGIVKKYSNFVGFPILLNNEKVNTVEAIWSKDKNAITEKEHTDFYRYISNAYDKPVYRLHFKTDAPIEINALFYMPERHMEKYGMGRQEPGVSLYSRKVLIQPKCVDILPEWMRFIKGVVDSADIPLNISRENMQDSGLIKRMNQVLTKRVLKYLEEEAKADAPKYQTWYNEFANFIKEGVCADFANKEQIARLLRYETSTSKTPCSLDDYISRMPMTQHCIYYLNANSRNFAESSPYYETFKKRNIEVVFLYNHIDDFVVKALTKYEKRKLVSIEAENVELPQDEALDKEETKETVDPTVQEKIIKLFEKALEGRVKSVKATTRSISAPAIVVDHESAAARRMMQYINDDTGAATANKQKLEINMHHSVIKKLVSMTDTNPDLANLIAAQVFDNALIAADAMDKPQSMLDRLNKILDHVKA